MTGNNIQDSIYRISEAANTAQSLEELYRLIHTIISDLIPARNFYIALYDAETATFSFPYWVDEYDPPPQPRRSRKGLTEYVMRTGEILLAPRDRQEQLCRQGEVERIGEPAVDWIGVPLKTQDRAVGVLVLQSYTEGVCFGENEKKILAFVSTQIALAIQRKAAEEALRESEERYRAFVMQSSEGIWRTILDKRVPVGLPPEEQADLILRNSRIVECNDTLARMYGFSSAGELMGRLTHIVHPGEQPRDLVLKFIREGYRLVDAEAAETDRHGTLRHFLYNSIGIQEDHALIGIWGIQRDITDEKRSAEALRTSEQRYRSLFERNLAGVFRSTLDGKVLDCNDSFARILGYESREQLLSVPATAFYPGSRDRQVFIRLITQEKTLSNFEIRLRRKDGSTLCGLENVALLSDAATGAQILEGTLIDITDRKRVEEQIVYQAYHDPVTGLPNRSLLRDRLSQALVGAIRQTEGLAVLFLDLDHFKLINDTLGHSMGDWLLKETALRLQETVREVDTVARLGGDEFVLLLPGTGRSEDAARVSQKILDAIALPFAHESGDLFITTSIGISMFPADGHDVETLIKSADTAMYRAKELGRNTYQLSSPALNARAKSRLSLENDLRQAVEKGEFLLHYQPQFDTRSGKICGVEALIRWNHPKKGLIPPREFIPIAEETRLVLPIGEWVLRTACARVRRWRDAGMPDLRLSVNLSARQFQYQSLIDVIENALAESRLPPSSLVVEITESVAVQNMDLTMAVLHTLQRKGVLIALDDFGVGYSTLAYLKHFPVHMIKIDPSFVCDIGKGTQENALVRAVIYLGHNLERRVIAEGVETREQSVFLASEGCEEVQGFFYARPQSAEEVEEILQFGRWPDEQS